MADGVQWIRVQGEPFAEAARLLGAAISRLGSGARLAVAGGSSAPVVGALRGHLGKALWRTLRLTWVDERCVPFLHPDSNRGEAYRQGHLDPLDPPGLELPLFLDGESPEAACARVQTALRQDFQGGLDVLLLGMGEDGHIASLFPGRAWDGALVFAVGDSPKPPASRITLGLPLLGKASTAVLLALGDAKRDALHRLAQGDPGLPAGALPHLQVITDQPFFPSEARP